VLALGLLLAVLSAPAPAPDTQTACEAAGGTWGRFGLLGTELCNLPTSDAGRPCTDNSDCESVCVAPDGAKLGDHVTGQCYGRSLTLGTCLPYVLDGVAQAVLCVD
jgi:hypothetical protein